MCELLIILIVHVVVGSDDQEIKVPRLGPKFFLSSKEVTENVNLNF